MIPEHARICVTRVRLSSHRLKVETGRWARIPRDQRLCSCGQIQDEEHVLLKCPLSAHLRRDFWRSEQVDSLSQLFDFASDADLCDLCTFCLNVMNIYDA